MGIETGATIRIARFDMTKRSRELLPEYAYIYWSYVDNAIGSFIFLMATSARSEIKQPHQTQSDSRSPIAYPAPRGEAQNIDALAGASNFLFCPLPLPIRNTGSFAITKPVAKTSLARTRTGYLECRARRRTHNLS